MLRPPPPNQITSATAPPPATAPDTFPQLLLEHARLRPDRPAMREKDYGIWQSWSWAEIEAEVRGAGVRARGAGFGRGDKLAIIGDNRPRLYWAMRGAGAGRRAGAALPGRDRRGDGLRPRTMPRCASRGRRPGAGRQAAGDHGALSAARADVYYDDPRGLRHYDQGGCTARPRCRAGARVRAQHPGFFAARSSRAGAGTL